MHFLITESVLQTLVTVFQCIPLSGLWNHEINATCGVNNHDFFIANAIPNILTDMALIALPLPCTRLSKSKLNEIDWNC